MTRINATDSWPLSKFIVSPNAILGNYSTIQSAITAAVAPANIYITPGSYTENLTMKGGVNLIGIAADGRTAPGVVQVIGNHIFNAGGTVFLENIEFESAAGVTFDISPAAGGSNLYATFCNFTAVTDRSFLIGTNPGTGMLTAENCIISAFNEGLDLAANGSAIINDCQIISGNTSSIKVVGGVTLQRCFMSANVNNFFLTNAGATVLVSYSELRAGDANFNFGGAGNVTSLHNICFSNTPPDYVTGAAGTYTFADEIVTGAATVINAAITQVASLWRPNATSGTSITAVRGSAGFDSTQFTLTDGFASITNPIQTVQVTLTSAQVKALRASPVDIVPAPGVGKTILPISSRVKLNYAGSNVFTNPQNLNFLYTGPSLQIALDGMVGTGFIDQASNTYQTAYESFGSFVTDFSEIENVALIFKNVGGSEITGNAANDNTVVVTVVYEILTQ